MGGGVHGVFLGFVRSLGEDCSPREERQCHWNRRLYPGTKGLLGIVPAIPRVKVGEKMGGVVGETRGHCEVQPP